jgi:hypothetical protein
MPTPERFSALLGVDTMATMKMLFPAAPIALLALFAGCSGPPRDRFVQWAARDQWDSGCASAAIVEQWKVDSSRTEKKDGADIFVAEVSARFKLVNACTSTNPGARTYKQFETSDFRGTITMTPCKQGGESGWGLTGGRCWTDATPVGQ